MYHSSSHFYLARLRHLEAHKITLVVSQGKFHSPQSAIRKRALKDPSLANMLLFVNDGLDTGIAHVVINDTIRAGLLRIGFTAIDSFQAFDAVN
jgi:hypothetical protein